MKNDKIILLIDITIVKLKEYIINSKFERTQQKQIIIVLEELKNDLKKNEDIRERLLRGFKDICTTTAINFEETNYAEYIFEIKNELEQLYPEMNSLKLLGIDFGKGDPI